MVKSTVLAVALILFAGLPAGVAERRNSRSLDLDEHAADIGESADVETNLTASSEGVHDYFVFVRMINIQIPTPDWLAGGGINVPLAYHTETMFCPYPKDENMAFIVEDNLKDKLLSEHPKLEDHEVETYSKYLTDTCLVTGFAGLTPQRISFSSKKMKFFYGPYDEQTLYYEGTVKLDVRWLVSKMAECGNWDSNYYSLFYHNCNYYTKALMNGLGFESPTFQSEKVLGGPWLRYPGYYSVNEKKCKGMKCTGRMTDWDHPRRGVCDTGKCYDGSDYVRSFRTCKSQMTMFQKMVGLMKPDDVEAKPEESGTSGLDRYWQEPR